MSNKCFSVYFLRGEIDEDYRAVKNRHDGIKS